jgi:hypothetical protein
MTTIIVMVHLISRIKDPLGVVSDHSCIQKKGTNTFKVQTILIFVRRRTRRLDLCQNYEQDSKIFDLPTQYEFHELHREHDDGSDEMDGLRKRANANAAGPDINLVPADVIELAAFNTYLIDVGNHGLSVV